MCNEFHSLQIRNNIQHKLFQALMQHQPSQIVKGKYKANTRQIQAAKKIHTVEIVGNCQDSYRLTRQVQNITTAAHYQYNFFFFFFHFVYLICLFNNLVHTCFNRGDRKQVTNDIEKVVSHRPHIKYHLGVVIYDQSCILLGLSLIKTPMKMDYQQGPLLIGTNH